MSGNGNGVDIAAVYQLLSQVAQNVEEHTRVLNEHTMLLRDHDRKLDDMETGQANLRQTITRYHSSVIGHGIMISELEHRVTRIEQHLNLPPRETS